jgi:hypothetical protein
MGGWIWVGRGSVLKTGSQGWRKTWDGVMEALGPDAGWTSRCGCREGYMEHVFSIMDRA